MAQIYFPSLVANLTMRFDEALLAGDTPESRSVRDMADIPVLPPGLPSLRPLSMVGAGSRLSKVIGVVARSASVELPGYRQAGKFTLRLAFRDFPVDPRAVRAVGVEIFLGTVPSVDFARGMRGQVVNGRAASLISAEAENRLVTGVADELEVVHGDRGSEVTIQGRDLRGGFLDAKLDPATLKGLNMDWPIHMVVAQILSRSPLAANVPIEVSNDEWPNGVVPAPAAREVVTRINQGSDGGGAGMPAKGDTATLSFWDAITQFCLLVGGVPYFDGPVLRIRPARSLFERKQAGKPGNPTPFKDGTPRTIETTGGTEQLVYRRMVYGRDISNFRLNRKLGGAAKVPAIRCVSVDTSSTTRGAGKLLEVTWPDVVAGVPADAVARAKTTSVSPSGDAAQEDVLTISVPGIRDKERLREVARNIYEEVGRGELTGSVTTKNLASFGGDNDDPDLLRLRPGDPVEFLVDATGLRGLPPVISALNDQTALSLEEAVKDVTDRFGDADLARVLVGTARGEFQRLQTVFRVSGVRFDWNRETGVQIDFDFQNYIEARFDLKVGVEVGEVQIESINGTSARVGLPEIESRTPSSAVSVTIGTPQLEGVNGNRIQVGLPVIERRRAR